MRLKYKKIVLIITMSTMGIGLVTLSLSHSSRENDKDQKTEATLARGSKKKNSEKTVSKGEIKIAEGMKDDGTLMENAYPQVNNLIQKFLDARVASDIKTINSIVSKTNPITLSGLQKEAEYIEGYQNVSCYTMKGPEEDSFIVYIYEEIKLVGIDTLAPGMTRVYVCKDENGKLFINFGQVEDGVNDYINAADKDEEVISLIKNVDIKLEEAITKDPALKEFTQKLSEVSSKSNEETEDTSKTKDAGKKADTSVKKNN